MRERWPRLRDRLVLGDGLEVSPICLGMVGGINFFFVTADMHWPL